jgi:hypothetical protein
MRLLVECEVCGQQYPVRTLIPTDGNLWLNLKVRETDIDCPHCGAFSGRETDGITAAMVRTLWDEGIGGLMDCKRVLHEADGDMDLARKLIRGWR